MTKFNEQKTRMLIDSLANVLRSQTQQSYSQVGFPLQTTSEPF